MKRYFKVIKEDRYFIEDESFNMKDHLIEISKEDYYNHNPRLIWWHEIYNTVRKGLIIWFFLDNKQFVTVHTVHKTIQTSDQHTYKYYHENNRVILNDKTLKKYCNLINKLK